MNVAPELLEKLIDATARIMRGRKVRCVLRYGTVVSPPRWLHLLDDERSIQDTWDALTITMITVKRGDNILSNTHVWDNASEYELHVAAITTRLLALFPRLCPRGTLVNLVALGGEALSRSTRATFETLFGGLNNAVIVYNLQGKNMYEHRGTIPSTSVVPLLIGKGVVNGVSLDFLAVGCLWARVYVNNTEYAFHETLPCVGSADILHVRVEIPQFET